MAGQSRGSDQGEDASVGVSERSLFADVPLVEQTPVLLPVPDLGIPPSSLDGPTPVPAPATGPVLRFHGDEPVELLLERAGRMPLPPYIASKRPADEEDRADYQTMFAREEGAVAAPTAALHFTPRLLEALDARGIGRETLTLHVGAGTFLPVKADDTSGHQMHAEWGRIEAATSERLNAVRASGGRLIAVGTTSLRLLESAAGEDGAIRPFEGDTAIFITPGYRFKAIGGLITNFHLPRSTLFMLVSALMGLDVMKSAYAHAIDKGYRFYSYGDASLLLPVH